MSSPRVVRGVPVPLAMSTQGAAAPAPAPKLPADPAAAMAAVFAALELPTTASRETILAAVAALVDVATPAGVERKALALGLTPREARTLAETPGANVAEYVRLRPKAWKR